MCIFLLRVFAYYSHAGRVVSIITSKDFHTHSVGCKRKFTYHTHDLFIGVDHDSRVVYAMERERERDEVIRESKRKGKGSP